MKAVIIAGGRGTRLKPLTDNTPKPIVPVVNVPLILHQIDLLKRHGIRNIILNLHYLSDGIKKMMDEEKRHHARIYYSLEESPLGTAGAVKNAEEFFEKDDLLVVFNGDVITDLNISRMIDQHKKKKARVSLALTPVEDPTPFGLVIADQDGKISDFIEKPSWEKVEGMKEYMINAGTYVIDPKLFKKFPAGQPFMFEKHFFPNLLAEGVPMYGYKQPCFWIDVGDPQKYRQAHDAILRNEVAVRIYGHRTRSGVWMGDDNKIHKDAKLYGPSLLGRRVMIGKGSQLKELSVLGDGVKIGEHSQVEHSIIWAGCQIGNKVQIQNSILGFNCRVEDNVKMDGAILADNTVISRGSNFNV